MSLTGMRLEFDDGTVFRTRKLNQISHDTTPLYKIDGFQTFITIYNNYIDQGGQDGRADSNMSGLFAGFGAGIHTVRIQFIKNKGDGETWGGSDTSEGGDDILSILQTLNRAITTKRADSESPAILQVGEYSDSGKYNPIPVAIGETQLPLNPQDIEEVSVFTGSLEFYDSVDLTQAVSSVARRN